jgi:hypothetical protein
MPGQPHGPSAAKKRRTAEITVVAERDDTHSERVWKGAVAERVPRLFLTPPFPDSAFSLLQALPIDQRSETSIANSRCSSI